MRVEPGISSSRKRFQSVELDRLDGAQENTPARLRGQRQPHRRYFCSYVVIHRFPFGLGRNGFNVIALGEWDAYVGIKELILILDDNLLHDVICLFTAEARAAVKDLSRKPAFQRAQMIRPLPAGSTRSTRWAAESAIRRPSQLGQRPRRLQEKASSSS